MHMSCGKCEHTIVMTFSWVDEHSNDCTTQLPHCWLIIIRYSIHHVKYHDINTVVHRQTALNLISEFVEGNDFSNTVYNSTYVSDVQSLIALSTL